jgi:predicted O-methyltransferase YrrM
MAVVAPPALHTTADIDAWAALAPLRGRYLPWSSSALRPAGLVAVLNDIEVFGRRALVELGGGVSSVHIARLLASHGEGRLVTVEHDPGWAAWLQAALAREGLDTVARVARTPLAPHPLAWQGEWYAPGPLLDALPAQIDLLLVDGPPAFAPGTERSRYPALPVLLDRLTPDATVVLDDVGRDGERAVLERWEDETPLRFQRREEHGRIAIARADGSEPLGA